MEVNYTRAANAHHSYLHSKVIYLFFKAGIHFATTSKILPVSSLVEISRFSLRKIIRFCLHHSSSQQAVVENARARTCNRTQWFIELSFHNRSYPAPKVRTYVTDGLSRWAGPRSGKAPCAPSLPPHPGRPGLLSPPLKGNAFFACLQVSVDRSI